MQTDIPEEIAGNFSGTVQPEEALSLDQLQIQKIGESIQLVDACATERFAGELEPIDPVAGHIPGALNRPLMESLQADVFKSAEQLREEWLSVLKGADPVSVVHMCGSGVTAAIIC